MRKSATIQRPAAAFTLVEVMIAAVILTVGFMGMIQAVTVCSGMMDQARRQTLATQILNHEIERMRLLPWDTIKTLPTPSTAMGVDCQVWPGWQPTASYRVGSVVSYLGGYYRCIQTAAGQMPSDPGHWVTATTGLNTDILFSSGATFSLNRVVNDIAPGSLREVTFIVTWTVRSGRRDDGGNPVTFNYIRSNSAWFGKYGLNLSYQRS